MSLRTDQVQILRGQALPEVLGAVRAEMQGSSGKFDVL